MSDDIGKAVLGGINSALGVSQNEPQNPVNPYSYEELGKFSQKISQSEERVYLQSGYARNLKPRAMEILFQEPDATIVIKKRQFSSLAENYRLDRLDNKTRTYIKAVKRLFYNKCRRIAAYERLTKLEKIYSTAPDEFSDLLFPVVFSLVETFNAIGNSIGEVSGSFGSNAFASVMGKNFSVLDTLKKVRNLSSPELFTTWSNPAEIPYLADVGEGTGTFELTLATSINTSVSTQMGQGSCDISFENPYELMIITQEDIEEAISDVVGFTNNSFFGVIKGELQSAIKDLTQQLSVKRLGRKASPIFVVTNPDSLQFKKVRAFIDEEGREIIFNYDPGLVGFGSDVSFDETARLGVNGLRKDEESLLKQIIINYYSLIDNEKLTNNQIKTFNQENEYVRKKMRLEFEDRSIIQQQDIVHVFIGSKTSMDPAVSAGFNFSYSQDNFFNQAEKQLDSIREMGSSINDFLFTAFDVGGNFVEFEKNAIAGPDFPLWLWLTMRNEFTRQAAGTHVFAGVADDIRQQYSGGKHTVSVSCKDFTSYLQKGQLNIKPAQDVIDSSIYDPLTPFKSNFDPASGILQGQTPQLLDENVALLNTQFVRTKAGRNKGSIVNVETYGIQDLEILTPESPSAKKRVQFFDPDGFVYRWKEGIGTLILSGAPHSYGTGSVRKETSSVITNNPFSGQDVMNTLSLLITGQPYNFSTFLKSATKAGYIKPDKVISYSSSENFLKGLITDINKTNSVWGNFVPFKRLGLTDAAYRLMLQGEFEASINNQYINDLLKKKAEQLDALAVFFPGGSNPRFFKVGTNNTPSTDSSTAQAPVKEALRIVGTDIFKLDQEINSYQEKFVNTLSSKNVKGVGNIKIFGDDISVEGVDLSSASEEDKIKGREIFRKNLLHLTQRRLWKVKANDDQNYFIVDDSYDKNYDIQAFEDALGDLTTFKSTYTSIFEQVKQAADLLGLEVFADSQGHINARPPAYNKIPSSVLADLIKIKEEKGIKLFPDYLESLFFNQVKGLTDKLEILEDQIRLRTYLLGAQNDFDIGNLLGGSQEITGQSFNYFSMVTDPITGSVDVEGLQALLIQNDPDFKEEANKQPLTAFNAKLTRAVSKNIQFDIVKRVELITGTTSKTVNPDKIKEVQGRLKAKYFEDELVKDISNYKSEKGNLSQSKMLDLFAQIVPLISERQYVIKLLVNALKNLEDGSTINNITESSSISFNIFTSLNSTSAFGSVKIPEVLIHMVEDEAVDDLGPGSGSRYIIKDSSVISFTITESVPPFTVVEVNGSIANNLVTGPSGIEVGNQGNMMNTAFVADYDMWRLYGFKGTQSVSIPFFDDPALQCAPYGVFLLNQARKNILNIDLTVIGNEFIQAGEVYYLESRDLLFYAENVRHQFDFGSGFQTSIKGTYVRKPGEFIPTMLDIIGKGLYTRRNQSDLLRVVRNIPNDNENHLGVLKAPDTNNISSEDFTNSQKPNSYLEINRQAVSSILFSISGFLNPSSYGKKVKVQLRVYHDSSVNAGVEGYAKEIKKFLISPEKYTTSTSESVAVPDDAVTTALTDKDVEVVAIKLGDNNDEEQRTPSAAAWDLARKLIKYPSGANEDADFNENNPDFFSNALKSNLFLYVIDAWAVFTDNEDSGEETSNAKNEKTNENDQELENYLKNLAAAVAAAEQTKQKADETLKTIAQAKK